jgi:hypothetical protein
MQESLDPFPLIVGCLLFLGLIISWGYLSFHTE